MNRSITVLLLVVVLVANLANAGRDARNLRQKKVATEPGAPVERPSTGGGAIINGALSWSVIDSMQNAFGPANSGSKLMAYDELTDRLAVIHRASTTYGAASGQLWYNVSSHGANIWTRVSELNAGTELALRYPSCALSNPTNSTNQADLLFTWAAPRLFSGTGLFGAISYGLDQFGAGAPFAAQGSDTALSSQVSIWTVPGSAWVYWASEWNNTYHVWRTNDYVTVNEETPATWQETPANFSNPLGYINGDATANGSYFAVQALFPGDSAEVINFGYSKSTDDGATWSGWTRPQPDWRYATGIPLSWDLMDYLQPAGGTVDYIGDFIEDGSDHAHFFNAVVDSPWTATATRGILETFETGSGWESKWITVDLHEQTNLAYNDLDQTHQDIHAAISNDGSVLAVVWLDAGTDSPTDTLPDVWFSWRATNGGNWSTPENLSLTPGFAELILHAAPTLKTNGGDSYTIFLSTTYQSGVTTYPPLSANQSTIYGTAYTFTAATSVGEGQVPFKYALEQNYPNPFNPSTKITFTLPQKSEVNLSVFNVLGEEVAVLFNGTKNAGTHEVGFSAANLPSGIYFYTLKAGQFTETKKMVLMK